MRWWLNVHDPPPMGTASSAVHNAVCLQDKGRHLVSGRFEKSLSKNQQAAIHVHTLASRLLSRKLVTVHRLGGDMLPEVQHTNRSKLVVESSLRHYNGASGLTTGKAF